MVIKFIIDSEKSFGHQDNDYFNDVRFPIVNFLF